MTIQTPDLIKAVGFLTIYWGYLEMEVDTLIRFASPICPMPRGIVGAPITIDKFLERPFRNRVEYLKKCLLDRCDAVQQYPDLARERQRIEVTLLACLDAATERNTMMHSAIYSLSDRGTVKRERLSGYVEKVDAEEVCKLANYIFELGTGAFAMQFVADRLTNAPLR